VIVGRVFQIMECLVEADGVSRMARDFAPLLGDLGAEPRILTLDPPSSLRDETMPLDAVGFRADDTILFHVWGPTRLEPFLRAFPGRRVLFFNNVTPPHFFPEGSDVRRSTAAGWAQLPRLVALGDTWLAPSQYNFDCLAAIGARPARTRIVPPVIERMDSRGIVPDPATLACLRDGDRKHVVFVGRLAPHKAVERVVEVFAHYHARIEPRSRLHLVGSVTGDPAYVVRLRRLAVRLGVADAIDMPGLVSEPALAAYWTAADAFLGMSEHEGFWLPPFTAAAYDVPVVVRAAAAVAETVAPFGLLVHRYDPARVAELLHLALDDAPLRARLRACGAAAITRMTRPAVRDALAGALALAA
jgi:glycosyltransferase involved in cell wall biosynthesis